MLLNDPVADRFHWPCHANLTVNGLEGPVPARPLSAPLDLTGRDAPVTVLSSPSAVQPGSALRVCLAGYDPRAFVLAARLARL